MIKYMKKEHIEELIRIGVLPDDDFIRMNPHVIDVISLFDKLPASIVKPERFKENGRVYYKVIQKVADKDWVILYKEPNGKPINDAIRIEHPDFVEAVVKSIITLNRMYDYKFNF